MPLSDEELIRRFRQGEEPVFEELVARWSPVVLQLALRLLGDPEEARDVRQMTLIRAYRALPGFGGRASFSTWLYAVVLNLCRDQGRRREREARLVAARSAELAGEAGAGLNGHAAELVTPERDCAARERAERVAAAVLSLDPHEREVVVLRHYHELPFPEIAAILAAPITTVKSRLAKGLERLRVRLQHLE